ncbi:DUF2185 domain-containing protein [Nocardioides pinisoli]|uniref:DUF2185 domain-containing protein n=1 Tax=Nocardioides pinisoli TaxID=2950279 RepID=A0ABT1KRW4_9ACTN|nr:DUF2185 domain-containing protein [Nocardioides pinisoli]MCP3420482.1 DUF2185 domain-containing protein [Nocardioides pinisoli]
MSIEFIPGAGACLVSKNVLSGAGRIKWMVREESRAAADNGWRIFSHIDTTEYLHDANNLVITDFNSVCELEPALIGIWDLPVGSDLQIVDEGDGIQIVDTATGRPIPTDQLYVPRD